MNVAGFYANAFTNKEIHTLSQIPKSDLYSMSISRGAKVIREMTRYNGYRGESQNRFIFHQIPKFVISSCAVDKTKVHEDLELKELYLYIFLPKRNNMKARNSLHIVFPGKEYTLQNENITFPNMLHIY